MPWNLFTRMDDGKLVSEGSFVPDDLDTTQYEVIELAERPDWSTQRWDATTRQLVDRPPPVIIDRLDDLNERFLADPDFAAVWNSLNATRKTQLRDGLRRVLGGVLRDVRYRDERESVEL